LILADFHVHSDNSPDGTNSVIELCESAVLKGLSYIAVTDHCEIDSFYKDRYNIGYRQSYIQAKKAMTVFKDQLCVRAGVELGQATADLSVAGDVTSLNYDFILGSLHALSGRKDFAFLSYGPSDVKTLFSDYLGELARLAEWGGFDSLAHLTYPLRYINGENGHSLKTEDFGGEIETVLRAIVKRGIALEINTSGLRQKLQSTMPDLFCLRLYKSLGGELLTLGSDAHRSADIGAGIEAGVSIAKEAGFDRYCVYTGRKPEFVKF
jgi:histidinol phosphate phosphatase HisJ family